MLVPLLSEVLALLERPPALELEPPLEVPPASTLAFPPTRLTESWARPQLTPLSAPMLVLEVAVAPLPLETVLLVEGVAKARAPR